jgi:hypothetical protein
MAGFSSGNFVRTPGSGEIVYQDPHWDFQRFKKDRLLTTHPVLKTTVC